MNINDITLAWLNQQDLSKMKPQQVAVLYEDAYKKIANVINKDNPQEPGNIDLH